HEVRGAARERQADGVGEQLADASEVAAVAAGEHRLDQIAGDDELRSGRDRAHRLWGEAREEATARGLPHDLERRREDAGDAAHGTALFRRLVASAPVHDHDSTLRDRLLTALLQRART